MVRVFADVGLVRYQFIPPDHVSPIGEASVQSMKPSLDTPSVTPAVAWILEGGSPNADTTFSDPQAPSVLPLANTQDRPDTRVDADEFVDDFLSEYDDYISLAEDETESEPAPTFDLKAATGFGDDKEASLRSPSAHHRNIKALMTLGGVYISHAKHKASGTSLRLRA